MVQFLYSSDRKVHVLRDMKKSEKVPGENSEALK